MADESDRLGTFGRGYTASAHPVATAVALEDLAAIEERTWPMRPRSALTRMRGWRVLPIIGWSAKSAAAA